MATPAENAPPAAGPYLQTVSGRWVNPFDPDPAQLDPGDIARALANERCAFSAEVWHWPELEDVEPLDLELTAWSPDRAADEFARRYAELDARR